MVSNLDPQIVDDFSDAYYELQKNLEETEKQIEELNKQKEEEDEQWDKLIKDLQDYCRVHEKHVVREAKAKMPTKYGQFDIYGYVNDITGEHHVALVKGEIGDGENVLCRVHSECLTGDVFGSNRCDCGEQLAQAMRQIEKEGRGILLYMRQ